MIHRVGNRKKANILRGKRLSKIARYIRQRNLTETGVDSANTSTLYWTCLKRGKLRGIANKVSVAISKRHPRDKRPEFFLCTGPSKCKEGTEPLHETLGY